MKRRIITICVCVLLGVIVNVAIAGYLAIWRPGWDDAGAAVISTSTSRAIESELQALGLVPERQLDSVNFDVIRVWTIGLRTTLWDRNKWSDDGHGFSHAFFKDEAQLVQAGWPKYCLAGERGLVGGAWKGHDAWIPPGSVWSMSLPANSWIPTRPLWTGFAINTVFYAAIIWLLFAIPSIIRRRLRIKRGLCPTCAYPVGTSAVCTECGKPVTSRGVEPTP